MRDRMEKWAPRALLAVSVVAAVSFIAGCSAMRHEIRVRTLSPAVTQAWPGVKADAERGMAVDGMGLPLRSEQSLLDSMDIALESGTCEGAGRVAPIVWGDIRRMALAGISDQQFTGEIGPGGAMSKIERVTLFGDALELCGELPRPEELGPLPPN